MDVRPAACLTARSTVHPRGAPRPARWVHAWHTLTLLMACIVLPAHAHAKPAGATSKAAAPVSGLRGPVVAVPGVAAAGVAKPGGGGSAGTGQAATGAAAGTTGTAGTTGASGAAASDSKASFEDAVNSFKYQDFDNAVPQLRQLLYPSPRVDRRREWIAREYLGAALWWVGSKNEANDEFTALLVRDGGHKLDPAVYPPKMISDFENLRTNLVRLGVIKADAPQQEPQEPALGAAPFGLMFVPFGVGQFANRSPGKGAAFLATEAVLAGVSAAFYYINQRDGLQGPGHMTTTNQAIQLSAGGAFFAVAVAGIIEAAVSWKPGTSP